MFLKRSKLYYIVENADWSIKWDGIYITKCIQDIYGIKACIDNKYNNIKKSIIHFGSRNLFLPEAWKEVHKSNRIVFTWFHGTEHDPNVQNQLMIRSLPEASAKADIVHTSCTISRDRLVKWGVPEEKVVLIPLGVDNNIFRPVANEYEKKSVRRKLGIPESSICIGSFQKDGNGWGNGDDPKLIKGPDILCEVISELTNDIPIHVLLTGPARGYVKNSLSKYKIPFTHSYLTNYQDIVKYYQAIDMYFVTSREEGGPKAILESMACGIPIISTNVGMANDIIVNGINGFRVDVEDAAQIKEFAKLLIEDRSLRQRCVNGGLETAPKYDWSIISQKYYEEIYSKLL